MSRDFVACDIYIKQLIPRKSEGLCRSISFFVITIPNAKTRNQTCNGKAIKLNRMYLITHHR